MLLREEEEKEGAPPLKLAMLRLGRSLAGKGRGAARQPTRQLGSVVGGEEDEDKRRLARREALRLWRDVVRTSKAFYWARPQDGQPWSLVLRESARKEFEQARNERDPIVLARLLVVGRQALEDVQRRFNAMEEQVKKRIDNTRIR